MRCLSPRSKEADMTSRSGVFLMALITGACGVFAAAASELAGTSWRLMQKSIVRKARSVQCCQGG
jgi:hypothetical protein